MSDKKLQVTMSLDQAQTIINALDFYSRMHMGQFSDLGHLVRMYNIHGKKSETVVNFNDYEDADYQLVQFGRALGFSPGASYGIYSPGVHQIARDAYSIQKHLRYVESWTRAGKDPSVDKRDSSMFGVSFDEPLDMENVKEPIKVEVVK